MLPTSHDEAVIETASQLKDSVSELMAAFARLPETIAEEHEAIKAGSFPAIEQTCSTKVAIGEVIDTAYARLMLACRRMHSLHEEICGSGPRPATLRGTIDQLAAINEKLGAHGLSGGVLHHLTNGVTSLVKEFTATARKTQPLIEVNRQVVDKLLENYQASYRFWQEITQETAATYNASGVQQARGNHSVLRIKA